MLRESYRGHTDSGVWDAEIGDTVNVELTDYLVNDKTIYSYYFYENNMTEAEKQNFLAWLEEKKAVEYLTADEAWSYVERNRTALGITDDMDSAEITWQTLVLEPSVLRR